MNNIRTFATSILLILSLSACSSAPKELRAPCPDFGKYCARTPINSLNESH